MSDTPSKDSAGTPLKLRLFNPHRLSDADLERSFIARQATFRAILDDILAEPADGRPQHHLVVGQRGMGKTTLLRRLAVELRRDPHRSRFIPLSFPEEQYIEVDRLSKFWLNCLDALADALEAEGAGREAVAAIDAAVKEVERRLGEETVAEASAREALTTAWRGLGRRPVLLIDNFNLLLNRLKDHDYALRGYFTDRGAPILIGACTDISNRLEDYGAAFYDGFKQHWLRPLTLEEMREVVERLARATGRQDVLNRLGQELPRLAALRDLTGGNPRTAVLLFDLFARGVSGDAYDDLESLLDLITPLYQTRLEQLSDQAQVIVAALARQWQPITAAELGEATGLANSSVSPQLGRLEDIGLVEKTPVFPSKRTGYQIAERFFNVWYLMRFATRRQRSHLESLTRFLETFHTPAERAVAARRMLGETALGCRKVMYAMAVADSLSAEPGLAHELSVKAQLDLVQQMKGVRERIAEILDPSGIDRRIYEFAELKERLRQAVPPDASVTERDFAELVLGSPALLPGSVHDAADRNTIASSCQTPEKVKEVADQLRDEVKRLNEQHDEKAVDWLRSRLQRGLVTAWNNADEISAAILSAADAKQVQLVLNFTNSSAKRKVSREALEKLRYHRIPETASEDGFDAHRWFGWACELDQQFGRPAEAEKAYRKALDLGLDPLASFAWSNLGDLLARLGRDEEAAEAYRRALDLDLEIGTPAVWNNLGAMRARRGEVREAEEAYRKAVALNPEYSAPWCNLGDLLQLYLERYAEAEEAYRKAIAIDPTDAAPWNGLGNLMGDYFGRFNEARAAFEKVLELNPAEDSARYNLAFLLRDFCGDPIAARERLEGCQQTNTWRDTSALHDALFAAYDDNWGMAATALRQALRAADFTLPPNTRDDWFRASAVLLHLGFGEKLVALLEEEGAGVRMLPWFAAVRAHTAGDRRDLLNVPAEARPVAEKIYDEIQKRRERLAAARPSAEGPQR